MAAAADQPRRRVHARAADRGAPADRADRHRLRRQRGAAGARSARAEGLGAGARPRASAAASSACSASTSPKRTAACSSTRSTSMIVSERMSQSASFGATFGAHANLMVLPLSLFGTEAQKRKYLPQLLTGEIVGAYCLSEPGSGSDALGAKTRADAAGRRQLRAERREDVDHQRRLRRSVHRLRQSVDDGEHFSAFIVERAFAGVSSGKEEHKMGLHGSSTTPVILQDVEVPGGEPARRGRQGPQDRVQRAELRALQARRDVRRRRAGRDRRGGALRGPAQAVRPADRVVRRDQAQARRDDRARLRGREPRSIARPA